MCLKPHALRVMPIEMEQLGDILLARGNSYRLVGERLYAD